MLYTILFISQLLPIIPSTLYYYTSICKCITFNYIIISKISTFMINLNLFIILSLSTNIHKKLFHIPTHNYIHITLISSILFWSTLHTIFHLITLQRIITINLYTTPHSHPTIVSGYTILIILLIISISTSIKNKFYHIFQYSHSILNISILSLLLFHSSQCFLKFNYICPPHTTWIWLLPPTILYIITVILKYTSHIPIHSILHIPHNITQINLPLPHSYIGKYIYICIPHINLLEWHPFTISHYNYNTQTCSIYIKQNGDWTSKLNTIHTKSLLYHGPFISLPSINPSTPNIFISTGIGITTFSHIIIHQHIPPLSKFIIITQHPDNIQWLLNITPNYNIQHLQFFFTQNHSNYQQQHLNSHNYKPNLKHLLLELYLKTPNPPINIFFSGNKNTLRIIKKICSKHNYYKFHTI